MTANVTIKGLYLFVPTSCLDPETQVIFNESIGENFTISFDSWTTHGQVATTGLEYQVIIGSAASKKRPIHLIVTRQTIARESTGGKTQNNEIFSFIDVEKTMLKIMGFDILKILLLLNIIKMNTLINKKTLKYFLQNMLENY